MYLFLPFKFEKNSILVELNQFCLQSFSASEKHLYNNNMVWVKTIPKETSVVNDDCSKSYIQHHIIVCFLLPLSTFIYKHSIQCQQYDPVTGIDDCPDDQNNLFWFRKGLSSLLDYCVDDPNEEDREPNRYGNQADEVHHYRFPPRGPPSRLVDCRYCKHFGWQQAWHVQYRVEWHEHHDYVTSEAAGKWRFDQCHRLHNEQKQQNVPEPSLVEELDGSGDEEKREEARDHSLVSHP